jgi:hypothetical protein
MNIRCFNVAVMVAKAAADSGRVSRCDARWISAEIGCLRDATARTGDEHEIL